MSKILVLGDTGLVGTALVKKLGLIHDVHGLSRRQLPENVYHTMFDLEKEEVMPVLDKLQPDIIITCSRGDFGAQLKTHQVIADYAFTHQVKVIFFSTANVFDGDPTEIKYEDSETNAVSDYGKYKAECESMLMEKLNELAVTVRLPMVFGSHAPRVNMILEAINKEEAIEVYENLILTVILDTEIADFVDHIIAHNLKGVFHLASEKTLNHVELYSKFKIKGLKLNIQKVDEYETYYLAIKSNRKDIPVVTVESTINCILETLK